MAYNRRLGIDYPVFAEQYMITPGVFENYYPTPENHARNFINKIQLENYMTNQTTAPAIDKGIFRAEVRISPAANGSFILRGYGQEQAFSTIEDMLLFFKAEGKKFEVGHTQEVENQKAAAKKSVN